MWLGLHNIDWHPHVDNVDNMHKKKSQLNYGCCNNEKKLVGVMIACRLEVEMNETIINI